MLEKIPTSDVVIILTATTIDHPTEIGNRLLYDYGFETLEIMPDGSAGNKINLPEEKIITGVMKSTIGQLVTIAQPIHSFASIRGKSKLDAYSKLTAYCRTEIKKLSEDQYQTTKQYAKSYPLYGSIWESNFDDPLIVFTIAKFLGFLDE